jgi:hypothetical protein
MYKRILCLLCAAALLVLASCSASDEPITEASDTISVATSAVSQDETEDGAEVGAKSNTANENEEDGALSVSVSEGVIGFASSAPTQVEEEESTSQNTVSATGYYPFEIQYQNHNGSPVIIKSFKVPSDINPESLVENDFKEDNYIYSRRDILMKESEDVMESKTVAEVINFATEDNDQATLLSTLTPIIEYNEGGYSGQLKLDYASIVSAEAGETSYSYPIRKIVEVEKLTDNDYAFLNKEMNGLTLESAEWDLHNGVQRAEATIPGEYTAQAVYTGVGYGSKVTGYNNTAYYTGTVTRTVEGVSVFSVVYKGIKDPSIIEEVVEEFPWTGVLVVLTSLILLGGIAVLLFFKIIPMIKRRGSRNGPPPITVPD